MPKTKVKRGLTKPSRIGQTRVKNIDHHKGKNAKIDSPPETAKNETATFTFPGKLA